MEGCALVTGAGGGIGAEAIRHLASVGRNTIGLDRSAPAGCDLAIACDVGSDEDVLAAKRTIEQSGMRPQVIVHCAAICETGGTLDTNIAQWARDYDVNLIGAVRIVQTFVPDMIASGDGGAIVFVSSINAQVATPTLASYAATKAALNSLTRTLALELAPHRIRVNAVAPASIDTPMLRGGFARSDDPVAAEQANISRHPLGRLGTPEDVAELIAFLASDKAGWITGTVLPIDGGALVTRR